MPADLSIDVDADVDDDPTDADLDAVDDGFLDEELPPDLRDAAARRGMRRLSAAQRTAISDRMTL